MGNALWAESWGTGFECCFSFLVPIVGLIVAAWMRERPSSSPSTNPIDERGNKSVSPSRDDSEGADRGSPPMWDRERDGTGTKRIT